LAFSLRKPLTASSMAAAAGADSQGRAGKSA